MYGEWRSACSAQRAVLVHKKPPAAIFVHPQPKPQLAMLTVASAPTSSEYGREKVRSPQQILAALSPTDSLLSKSSRHFPCTLLKKSLLNKSSRRYAQQVSLQLVSRPFPCRPQASELQPLTESKPYPFQT